MADFVPYDGPVVSAKPPPAAGFVPYDGPVVGASETNTVPRLVGQGATGFNDAVANTVGAPVDAAAWALRKLGVPANNPIGGSESIKKGIDYVATLPGRVTDAVGQGSVSPLTEDRTSRFEPATTGERVARGVGEGVGNALSVMVPASMVANTARAGTATQGVANVLASQPVVQTIAGATGGGVTGGTGNPLYGLAAGAAVPLGAAGIRGVVSPVTNRLTAQEQNLATAAEREGIRLTPAQATGSPTLKTVEGTMNSLPLASGPMQNAFREQRGQFNSAVLKHAGINADEASPGTINRAFVNAGQTFDDLASRTTINADPQLAQDITQVATKYGRRLDTNVAPIFKSYMDDLAPLLQKIGTAANPQIPGDIYATIRSDIGTTIRTNGKNPDLQKALGGLQDALDSAVERSTSGPLRQEWADARREYQALMTIDKSMQGGTQVDRSQADIPFGALKNAVAQSDRRGFSRGRGQLNELSRVGDFLGNRVPDSGTVPRGAVANVLTGGALFGGGIASGAGIPAAAAAATAPWAFSKFYNSRLGDAYLKNQAAGNTNFNALYGSQAAQQAIPGDENVLLLKTPQGTFELRRGGGQ